MQFLSDFNSLAHKYDHFLIDLWGTVHDGKRLFPGVQEQLRYLKSLKKQVIFVSNAPRPQSSVQQLLIKLELTAQHYDGLLTSGDVFLEDVRKNPELQAPFYFLGDTVLHASLLEQLPEPVKDISAANYILCSAVPPNYEDVLKKALAAKKLLVCVNPDLIVVDDGRFHPCAGSVAQEYANQGGPVSYYGKPLENIYDHAFKVLGNPEKEKVLMIGDGLYTDIMGANNYGIDSLLVNTGVHRIIDLDNPHKALEKLSQQIGCKPTYFIETLGKKEYLI